MTLSATGAATATAKFRVTWARIMASGPNSNATPKISAKLATLLPSASPKEISGSPASPDWMATVNSGLDVAKAATVAAMMLGATRAAEAIPTVPRTNSSPPPVAQSRPSAIAR